MQLAAQRSILCASDPAPVEIVNAASRSPILLVCEHAGQAIPQALGDLGIGRDVLDSHRGWDIGALAVARGVAAILQAPLIVQHYSRLVIDANRPPDGPDAVPERVDGEVIPGNVGITPAAQRARAEAIFDPFDAAIARLVRARRPLGCFSIHSFTPVMGGMARPWHAGFLTRRDPASAERMIAAIAARRPDLTLAMNEPYRIEDDTDWFIPRHAEPLGAAHALIEIRQDQIDTAAGAEIWADLIAQAISAAMKEIAP